MVLLVLFSNACKKEQTQISSPENNHQSTKPTTSSGAILDRDAYLKVPKANFQDIATQLKNNGFASKLRVNAPPPSSVYLNYPAVHGWGQESTGACVSFSIGYALMGTLNNEFPIQNVDPIRSPWFIFKVDHSIYNYNCNSTYGMLPETGLSIALNIGVASNVLYPFLGSSVCQQPPSSHMVSAATNTIGSYYRIDNINDLKTALSYRLPVEMAFRSYPSLHQAFNWRTTYTTVNPDGSNTGHAVAIVGYDDSKHAFLIQNSWGTGGGDLTRPGMMWFDYDLFTNPSLEIQLYVVTPNLPKFPVSELACSGTNLYSIGASNVGGGGNAIYWWANNSWRRLPGAATNLTGDSNAPWVVNNENSIYKLQTTPNINWTQPIASPYWTISDIAMGGGNTYAIDNTSVNSGGKSIYQRLSNGTWNILPGTAVKVAVESGGTPWVINAQNYCYRWNGSTFGLMPGRVSTIACGGGNVFALGINIINTGGYEIYKYNALTNNWVLLSGTATHIAVDSNGVPYIVNSVGHLYRGTSSGGNWTQLN